ncbi:MAG TPA: cell wall hydrolase [Rudaea sp.]|nr:cell wall hydrolase [Rudaea sp.]
MDALKRLAAWLFGLFKLPPTTDTPVTVPEPAQPAELPAPRPTPKSITVTSATTVEIVARTLWGEARGQGNTGMQAVCNVIQNRAKNPGWWGNDLRSVCLANEQFDCWNLKDPQAARMRGPINDGAFVIATAIANKAVAETLADLTRGADHYFAETIPTPSWAYGRSPTFVCGTPGDRHFFYKIGLGG